MVIKPRSFELTLKSGGFDFTFKPLPVIISANYKGGVGKTATSRVLAQGLASFPEFHQGKPILYIDLDPQCNTGMRFNLIEPIPGSDFTMPRPHPDLIATHEEVTRSSICDLWLKQLGLNETGMEPMPYPTDSAMRLHKLGVLADPVQPEGDPLIHIVPNDQEQLVNMQCFRPNSETAIEAAEILRLWLRSPDLADKYSFVIIDTPPTRTALIDIAIHAATHIYIPFVPEPQSVDGVYSMISYFTTKVAERHETDDIPLTFLGMLPNVVQNLTVHRDQMLRLKSSEAFAKYLMPCPLSRNKLYPETDTWQYSPAVVFANPESKGALESMRFVKYVAKNVMTARSEWRNFA